MYKLCKWYQKLFKPHLLHFLGRKRSLKIVEGGCCFGWSWPEFETTSGRRTNDLEEYVSMVKEAGQLAVSCSSRQINLKMTIHKRYTKNTEEEKNGKLISDF
jgi:hypothetical protein